MLCACGRKFTSKWVFHRGEHHLPILCPTCTHFHNMGRRTQAPSWVPFSARFPLTTEHETTAARKGQGKGK